ncbi:MAG: AAA family ATPase [Bacteroidetes bacterium]|nr:AAA family ATPase [Bacteroidota bacterium]
MTTSLNKRELLMKATANGKLFFTAVVPNLMQKNKDSFKTVSSPLRKDRKASFSVYRNPHFNIWLYNDFGDANCHGDMFDFAAMHYGMDIKNEFPAILDKMWVDLELNKVEDAQLERLAVGLNGTTDTFYSDIKIPVAKNSKTASFQGPAVNEEEVPELFYTESHERELTALEKQFLSDTGISLQIMHKYGAHFIQYYAEVYEDNEKSKRRSRPENNVWIVYDFKSYYKIYQPTPKRFWYVGKKRGSQLFGTPQVTPQFDTITQVYLTAGEKDALVLLSNGYNAMCLNSETQSVSKEQFGAWRNYNRYEVIVAYDNDATGIAQVNKLHSECGCNYIVWPEWLKEKGGKDVTDFFAMGGTKEEFETLHLLSSVTISDTSDTRLSVRTAAQRLTDAQSHPDILPHADVLFQTNELTILFGDTGKGKSIAAVAIADAISKGTSFLGLENKCAPLTVLYYDFELSDKQFQKRYSDENGVPYQFSDRLYIDNIDITNFPLDTRTPFEELLIAKISKDIKEIGAQVLIIDNLTFLTTYSAEDGDVAKKIMKLLKNLKTDTGVSILVLAHTPKRYGVGGLTLPDLAGSKHLSNFADSVMALGVSKKDGGLRYIIQVKASRTGEVKYDGDNVILCEIQKNASFLTLEPFGFGNEQEHLSSSLPETEEDTKKAAFEMKQQGMSVRAIEKKIGVSKSKIDRWFQTEKKCS